MLDMMDAYVLLEETSNNAIGETSVERSVRLNRERHRWVERPRHAEPEDMCCVPDLQKHFGIDSDWMVRLMQCTAIRTSLSSLGGCP